MNMKGRLAIGADADITVFDPERVIDRSTYENGAVPSSGIHTCSWAARSSCAAARWSRERIRAARYGPGSNRANADGLRRESTSAFL
jgi:hypothetical protein